jgi:hypothetical protein
MTTSVNFQYQYLRTGNAGMEFGSNASSGPGMVSDSLTSLFTTRGTMDLNLNRLPTDNDCTVRPSDPLVLYDAFVVSAAGTVFTGVTGPSTLNVGDLLVLMVDGGGATAADWMGIPNTGLQIPVPAQSSAYNGLTATNNVRVINRRLPFFP